MPIFREVMADLETPVSAYLKIRGSGPAFLLESIEGGERLAATPSLVLIRSRYSRCAPAATLESLAEDDGHDIRRSARAAGEPGCRAPGARDAGSAAASRHGGAVGYLSYEAVRAFEPRVPSAPGPGLDLPDGVWMLTDALLVFDHLARTIKAVAHVPLDDDLALRGV